MNALPHNSILLLSSLEFFQFKISWLLSQPSFITWVLQTQTSDPLLYPLNMNWWFFAEQVPKVACFCSEEQWLGWGEDGPGLWQSSKSFFLLSMFQDVRCKWAAKQNCGLQFKWAWSLCISKHWLSVFSLVCLFLCYVITQTSPPLCHCFSKHSTSELTMNFRLMWWSPHRCQQYHWHFCLALIVSWWGSTCILCKESLAIK